MCRDIAEYAGTVLYRNQNIQYVRLGITRSLTCCWEPQTNLPTKRIKRLRHQSSKEGRKWMHTSSSAGCVPSTSQWPCFRSATLSFLDTEHQATRWSILPAPPQAARSAPPRL